MFARQLSHGVIPRLGWTGTDDPRSSETARYRRSTEERDFT